MKEQKIIEKHPNARRSTARMIARVLDRTQKLRLAMILFGSAALVSYLSLRSSAKISEISWLPGSVTAWSDTIENGDLRTLIPYAILSTYTSFEAIWGFRLSRSLPILMWLLAAYTLSGSLFLFEILQIRLPHRTFAWADIGWGHVGILLGFIPLLIRHTLLKQSEQ